jgi:hypothetical protein
MERQTKQQINIPHEPNQTKPNQIKQPTNHISQIKGNRTTNHLIDKQSTKINGKRSN